MEAEAQWYPAKVSSDASPTLSEEEIRIKLLQSQSGRKFGEVHHIWNGSALKYTSQNWWAPSLPKEKKESCRRHRVAGVEVRDLKPPHFLAGQQGLFAVEKFEKFDIIGEYTGRIVNDDVNGHYVAALEDKALLDSLGLDAGDCGNEMR
jgi:hypothetical protein